MASDQLELREWGIQEFCGTDSTVGVAQAVEPEPPYPPLFVPLVGQSVEVGVRRQRGMEGRVEGGDVRQARKDLTHGVDDIQRRAVVKRREGGQVFDHFAHIGVNTNSLRETRTA